MKRALPVFALVVGLALTGCSGNDSKPAESGDKTEAGTSTSAAPQASQLSKEQLTTVIESTKVDGKTFKAMDAAAGGDAANTAMKALESAEFSPAECKDLSLAALNVSQQSGGTTVTGVATDNTLSVGLSSFADEDAAAKQLSTASKITEKCGEVTVKASGMEMTMTSETFDATVDGADESVGVRASMEAGGQPAFTTETVTSRTGNNLVSAVNLAPEGKEEAAVTTAQSFLEALKNAG
ncbi:hypothetical protein [Brevibacterium sp.]|uniref:hypothetical protein n=1 Tax=Brevibacterium sp. TaxID=1701 RepID=UPI002811E402|nr:hypothetical protein [Brevibacterium sp.]